MGTSHPDKSLFQMQEMAVTRGVDLAAAQSDGRIEPEAVAEMVARCRGCPSPDACSDWLEKGRTGAETTPDFCANKAIMDRLAAG